MASYKEIRTAVIGCGYWGRNLVRNLSRLSTLRWCCDADPRVRDQMVLEFPGTRATASFDDVLADPDTDAVAIVTPSPMHARMAVDALDAGKHVFVEKPLGLSVAEAEQVVDAAERAGRIAMVGHLMEYHPAVVHLKSLIDAGELGEVYYCYAQRLNLGKVRSSEDALWSLAPHDISVVLYLLGEEPEEVEATGQAFLQNGIDDVVFLTLKFASGKVAHIHVSWLDPHKERKLTVVGSRKMVTLDDMEPREKVKIFDKGVDRRTDEATSFRTYGEMLGLREGDIVIPSLPSAEPLGIECKAFLEAVATGVPPRTDALDGLRVVRVLEAATSMLQRRRVTYAGHAFE